MNKLVFVLLAIAAVASTSDVVELTDFTFDNHVTAPGSGVWFVRFYAPWCGHCKSLEPTWIEVAGNLKGKVNFGDVDATEEYGLAHRFSVRAYPTLVLFAEGKLYHFDGSRTLDGLTDFATSLYEVKPYEDIPKMPNILVVMFQKYMNKANIYLYQHPLFTAILLLSIGFVFGMCVVILIFETIRTNELIRLAEEEEAKAEEAMKEQAESVAEEMPEDE